MKGKIKNARARIWKKSDLNRTIKWCKAENFSVEKDGDCTTVTNEKNGDIVLMSISTGTTEIVRIDISYFE